MSNRAIKRARKRLRETQQEVAREAIARRIMPLCRRVVGIIVPGVKRRWIKAWDRRHDNALLAAMKRASHRMARRV